MSPAAELLTSGRSHGILAVHDECHTAIGRASAGAYGIKRVSEITMTAGHGKGTTRKEHTRSPDQSIRNGPRDTRIATCDISYRRESAVEGVAQHLGGVACEVGQGLRLYIGHLETGAENMTVRVNQSRHQGFAGDIHDIPISRSTRRTVHCHNAVTLDDHHGLVEVFVPHAVEDPSI